MTWKLSGSYFESCNCEAACPCAFLGPPTTGVCTAIIGWHIENGEYEGLQLDGLNVALAVDSPGHMATTEWRAAVYLDDRASEEQTAALGAIFSGAAGGHPAVLGSYIGEVLGVATAPITFEGDDASRAMRIGDVADVKITAMEGQGGAQVTIANHPLAVAPGQEVVAARADHLRFTDHGYEWELSESNGFFSPFKYEG
ncbi:MAG TPA: DUF1326 domain-containing protein [Acidimicrobiia bacterium]|nr:DUF1326 domain-containing protein [Acidimicrobiia bacterium]